MSKVKENPLNGATESKPLRGQMDIFQYIEPPRGFVANERAVKKRRSTVPGQINMFEYMDLQDAEQERRQQEAMDAAGNEMLPGQMGILEFLQACEEKQDSIQTVESEVVEKPLPENRLSEETNSCIEEDGQAVVQDVIDISDEDLLMLNEGTLHVGKIMRVLHISAVEAERVRQRLMESVN